MLEQRGTLVRYQTGARGCSIVKSMQIETGIHRQFYSNGLRIKQPGREADNHRHSSKMKDKPAVTAVTVRIGVVSDSCAQ